MNIANPPRRAFLLSICIAAVLYCKVDGFLPSKHLPLLATYSSERQSYSTTSALWMAKKAKKATKKRASGGSGVKGFGFGVGASSSKSKNDGVMDKSKAAMDFYKYLDENGGGENLKRVALGQFPTPDGGAIRGVMALKEMKKGDVILNIPYELAVNLGMEGSDPTGPAIELLKKICECGEDDKQKAYFESLPPFMGEDCLGSTDFFDDAELEAMQSPLVAEETLKRRENVMARFQQDVASQDLKIGGQDPVTEKHLQWAVWLITSRVLTVQGAEGSNTYFRLLIPLIDMCNHDRNSPHVLTGRAVPGGELKVVAGVNVEAGSQINICYGGGVAGNDRFIQDYGFLDSAEKAYDIVAKQLLGRAKVMEAGGKMLPEDDQTRSLAALRQTTSKEDEALLASSEPALSPGMQEAIQYRFNLKKTLQKYVVME